MDTSKIQKKLRDTTLLKKSSALYQRHKRFTPLVSFTAGFAWDTFTLSRIDLWRDNLIMLAYLLLLGFFIMLVNFIQDKLVKNHFVLNYAEWYPLIIQFLLGGLFSKYVIFYFQSATLSKNWLFILLLIVILVGNEFIRDRLSSLKFQAVLYFLASFSFFIFFIPVIIKVMNAWVFLLSGFISLGYIWTIFYFIIKYSEKFTFENFKKIALLTGIAYSVLTSFYFLNLIPPVPFSLKDAGIYHHIKKVDDSYLLQFEKGAWYEFWKESDDTFHYTAGDTVFCFASVFAPTRFEEKILHHWQHWNVQKSEWLTTDRLRYKIFGGRDGGYRGYTYKRNILPGEWRVEVKNESEQVLGNIRFDIVVVDSTDLHYKTITH